MCQKLALVSKRLKNCSRILHNYISQSDILLKKYMLNILEHIFPTKTLCAILLFI